MQRMFLLLQYPSEAEAWIEQLPHTIEVRADDAHDGTLHIVMYYKLHRIDASRTTIALAAWSYEHDANGRIMAITFSGHRDDDIYVELYNAIQVIGAFAERPAAPEPYHLGLTQCARWLLHYLDEKETGLREALTHPFPNPLF
ncbi:MAG: hypothetical protein QY323_04930 [Patescibacteria group bacterium]|nr:MAG: hypothetical protein QY323_04930 [Patescibacteria group bacterium]